MIDAYKIEEATKDYINKNNYFAKYEEEPCVDIEFAYKAGAHWAINESLKDLWHPYNEEPRNDSNIVYQNCDRDIHNNNTLKKTTKRVGVILYVSIVYGNGLTKMIYFQRKEVNND